jgi:hypothetical protein
LESKGKEAAPMRKALFAIVLVAASFGGGAVVNGPGLRWAQSQILSRMGYEDDGDAVSSAANAANLDPATTSEVPARPIPPLVIDHPAGPSSKTPATASTTAKTDIPTKIDDTPGALPGLPPVPESPVQAHDAPTAALTPAAPPLALETSRERERAAVELAAATAAAAQDPPPVLDATLRSASLADHSPAPAAVPTPAADTPAPATPPAEPVNPGVIPGDPADWPAVRRALRDLGVVRYGIEGETNGKVRFHCIIPLAGRRAVGQHFEADGDDEFQAARALLRRVALWRATEAPGR